MGGGLWPQLRPRRRLALGRRGARARDAGGGAARNRPAAADPGSERGAGPHAFERIAIAWKPEAQAARAVALAMPLARPCDARSSSRRSRKASMTSDEIDRLARYLGRHGLQLDGRAHAAGSGRAPPRRCWPAIAGTCRPAGDGRLRPQPRARMGVRRLHNARPGRRAAAGAAGALRPGCRAGNRRIAPRRFRAIASPRRRRGPQTRVGAYESGCLRGVRRSRGAGVARSAGPGRRPDRARCRCGSRRAACNTSMC